MEFWVIRVCGLGNLGFREFRVLRVIREFRLYGI
jgi:hypothetical protein